MTFQIPPSPGEFPGARFAWWIRFLRGHERGGDALFWNRDDANARVVFLFFDVAGNGESVHCVIDFLQRVLSADGWQREPLSPAELLRRLNSMLQAAWAESAVMTCALALTLDRGRRSAVICNAGQPDPLLIADDSDGGQPTIWTTEGGLPLGVAEEVYREARMDLSPRQSLFVCSDGVQETHRYGDLLDQFGENGIRNCLASADQDPDEVVASMLTALRRMAGEEWPQHDVTSFCLRLES